VAVVYVHIPCLQQYEYIGVDNKSANKLYFVVAVSFSFNAFSTYVFKRAIILASQRNK
jgi:hypothetical protein